MNVALIIPAYNEAETIQDVINIAKKSKQFTEIVVVSDGSTDNTVEKSLECNVKTIALPINSGKGAAMKVGVDNVESEVIAFLDADLVNIRVGHIEDLIEPIKRNEADMTCGIFKAGRGYTDFAQKVTPWLTGQRALKKEIVTNYQDLTDSKFGAELSLTKLAIEQELRVKKVVLEELTHRMKEEKMGIIKGFWARMRMYWQVFSYFRKNNLSYSTVSSLMD
jgi:glycosyltransferase involved in cell wall biosynthesis